VDAGAWIFDKQRILNINFSNKESSAAVEVN